MATTGEQLSRLGAKLDSVNSKLEDLTAQREQILTEIQNITGGATSKTTPATHTKPAGKPVKMGDKYLAYIREQSTPTPLATIAGKFKMPPQAVALSLFHLVRKGLLINEDNVYMATPMAAKTTPDVTDYKAIE